MTKKIAKAADFITAFILTIVIGCSIFETDTFALSAYNAKAAVAYAQKWSKSYNDKQYKRIDDDCTNFVSQCVVAGKGGMINPKKLSLTTKGWIKGWMCTSDSNSWYNQKYSYQKVGIKRTVSCFSQSFTFVDKFYNFWKAHGATVYGPYTDWSKNSSFQKKLKLGDIVQMKDSYGWHHSMIVTAGSAGNWRYCAHTDSAKDKLFTSIPKKRGRAFRIIRIK